MPAAAAATLYMFFPYMWNDVTCVWGGQQQRRQRGNQILFLRYIKLNKMSSTQVVAERKDFQYSIVAQFVSPFWQHWHISIYIFETIRERRLSHFTKSPFSILHHITTKTKTKTKKTSLGRSNRKHMRWPVEWVSLPHWTNEPTHSIQLSITICSMQLSNRPTDSYFFFFL